MPWHGAFASDGTETVSNKNEKSRKAEDIPAYLEKALGPNPDYLDRLVLGLTASMCTGDMEEHVPGSGRALEADKRKIAAEFFGRKIQQGPIIDPYGLRQSSPQLHALYLLQQKYGGELNDLKDLSLNYRAKQLPIIVARFEKDLIKHGAPYTGPKRKFVREAAFRFINPLTCWSQGRRLDLAVTPITFEARAQSLEGFYEKYEIGHRMTLALALMIEVANEVKERGVSNSGYRVRPGTKNELVCKLLAQYGFETPKLRSAANLIITTPATLSRKRQSESERRLKFKRH